MKRRNAYRLGWRALRRVMPNLSKQAAQQAARDLAAAMVANQITSRRRATMFIAQIAHESLQLHFREEIADGSAYEGRRDLGNTRPGDGRRFKGRTYIQITGRSNYAAVSKALNVDFLEHPERLAWTRYAAAGAAWWWRTHGCNQLADQGSQDAAFLAVTRRINGGTNGLADRQQYFARARRAWTARKLVPKRRPAL